MAASAAKDDPISRSSSLLIAMALCCCSPVSAVIMVATNSNTASSARRKVPTGGCARFTSRSNGSGCEAFEAVRFLVGHGMMEREWSVLVHVSYTHTQREHAQATPHAVASSSRSAHGATSSTAALGDQHVRGA